MVSSKKSRVNMLATGLRLCLDRPHPTQLVTITIVAKIKVSDGRRFRPTIEVAVDDVTRTDGNFGDGQCK